MSGRRRAATVVALCALAAGCGGATAANDAADGTLDLPAETAGDVGDAGADDAAPGADDGASGDAAGDDGSAPPVDPTAPGPWTWTVIDDHVVRGSRTTPVSALIPDLPEGATAPLVLFLPGFQMQTSYYLALCERLASHGLVVVRADPPGSLLDNSHPEQELDAQAVLDWALDPGGAVGPHVDAARVGACGHSNGGKVATMLAFADARVTALLGLDPVNGSGPLGFSDQQPDILPDQVAPLAVPLGFLGETTDTTGVLGGQACAPADQNFQAFYDAASAAPWTTAWELAGADHIDFVFDTSTCGIPCSMCRNGTADAATVHDTILTLAVAFFRRHFFGEPELERWLTGDLVPADVTVQHKP